ncbi:MAG: zf-HC2 domain-containing protein [Rubrobacter sp.]|nr:zf-HC2 domain-containing protein [Rubrobacter sp.]
MSIEELLPAYLTGELSEEERERVEAALTESSRLQGELSRYERLFVLLSAAAAEEIRVPTDLRTSIMLQITLSAYLSAAAKLAGDLLETYARAVVFFLRLA